MIIYIIAAISLFFLILSIFLYIRLQKKQILDKAELKMYQNEVDALYTQKNMVEFELSQAKQRLSDSIDQANKLDETLKQTAAKQMEIVEAEVARQTEEAYEDLNELKKHIKSRSDDYDNIIAPMALLEKEKQEKLFYTIHLTDDDKCDIIYLLTEVAPHVNHKDILSKLVWQEFIKNPLEDTLKRVGITQGPGIYKLTNLNNGMCYVGKSTNVKKRIQDHFKSVVGITSISDQRVHHEIMNSGIDNWTIEQLCECDREELTEKERFFIEFFKAKEYGYNII